MDLYQRKQWNENHKKLTQIITDPTEHHQAVELFLQQHALLHSSQLSQESLSTLEDELIQNLREETYRKYPVSIPDTNNSIVWHLWHITRIEDMTMNCLVHGQPQVLFTSGWHERLQVSYIHTGNGMTEEEAADLSAAIDIQSLLDYRKEVGRKTREIVSLLEPGGFKRKIETVRIQNLEEQQAVKHNALWLLEYWRKKTVAGLILMPATRHNFLHLNKSIRIKQKVQK